MSFIFFKNVFIRFLDAISLEIRWEIEPSPEDMATLRFVVYRSDSPESDFEPISPPLTDVDRYRDLFSGYRPSKFHTLFYKVRVYRQADPLHFCESPVEHLHENPFDDTISPFNDPVIDIVRRNNMMLSHPRYRIGKPCVIFQKRLQGAKCSCFDPITQRVTISNCKLCLGTGKLEGYHAGIKDVFVHFVMLPKVKMIQQWGDITPGDSQGWMSNYPIVKPEDIILNTLTNEHWLIKQVNPTFHLITVKQTLLLRKLNYDDVKTKLSFSNSKFRM